MFAAAAVNRRMGRGVSNLSFLAEQKKQGLLDEVG